MRSSTSKKTTMNPVQIRECLSLSRERFSTLLRVSSKTVDRWEKEKKKPSNPDLRFRFAKLKEIVDLGMTIYTAEGLKDFLSTPLPVFGGRTGFDLIAIGDYESVIAALVSDREGTGF